MNLTRATEKMFESWEEIIPAHLLFGIVAEELRTWVRMISALS